MKNQHDVDRVRSDVEHNFPDIRIDSIRFLSEGIGSKAFVVNDDMIFRFPKDAATIAEIEREIAVLPHLREYVSLGIPDFQYIGRQRDGGVVFVGYTMIDGVGLENDVMSGLDPDLQDVLHTAIARFIAEVHSFPVETARRLGVETVDFHRRYNDRFNEFQSRAARLVSPDARKYVNAMYESYLSDDRNFACSPVFLHGDLGANHIIYSPDTRSISGVIDFGGMCIGDPDRDFTYLYVDYWGPDFARQFPKYYDDRDMDLLVRKLEFFNRCNPVDHLLTGLQREDDGLVRYASKRLEAEAGSQAHR